MSAVPGQQIQALVGGKQRHHHHKSVLWLMICSWPYGDDDKHLCSGVVMVSHSARLDRYLTVDFFQNTDKNAFLCCCFFPSSAFFPFQIGLVLHREVGEHNNNRVSLGFLVNAQAFDD